MKKYAWLLRKIDSYVRTILMAQQSAVLSYLEEFQEARFGGARLPYYCHCCAEVVHILTVGIQHHGLRKLLRDRHIFNTFITFSNELHHMILTVLKYHSADSYVGSENFYLSFCGGLRQKQYFGLFRRRKNSITAV